MGMDSTFYENFLKRTGLISLSIVPYIRFLETKRMNSMGKPKTRKAVAKRFKKTATGKIKRQGAGRGHLFTGKPSTQKRRRRKGGLVAKSDYKRIAIHLPG